jgi:hypothetical protein
MLPPGVDRRHRLDLDRQLTTREWPPPRGSREFLDVAAELVCDRLDRSRPLWRACLVSDSAADRAALVLLFHHVLADRLGGLAVLATLADNRWDLARSPDRCLRLGHRAPGEAGAREIECLVGLV